MHFNLLSLKKEQARLFYSFEAFTANVLSVFDFTLHYNKQKNIIKSKDWQLHVSTKTVKNDFHKLAREKKMCQEM